jgi:hypothetical protein
MPLVQRQPALHAMSQAPQLARSTCKLTQVPEQDVSSLEQPALAPPVDAPPTLEPACPVLAPACPALASAPALPELPPLDAPELPTLPALPVVPALPAAVIPALPVVEPAAPAEPPSDVVLLEQPSNDRHAPQARGRNHLQQWEGITVMWNVSRHAHTRNARPTTSARLETERARAARS